MEASESINLPMLTPFAFGIVIWKLCEAICPTTFETPVSQEVLGQRLKLVDLQLSDVSPFEVRTLIIADTSSANADKASGAVSAFSEIEAVSNVWSGVAWIVASPLTVMVLLSQHQEPGEQNLKAGGCIDGRGGKVICVLAETARMNSRKIALLIISYRKQWDIIDLS